MVMSLEERVVRVRSERRERVVGISNRWQHDFIYYLLGSLTEGSLTTEVVAEEVIVLE